MVKGYIFLVVVYYLFGVLFLPDSICATGPYILGAFVFPVGVFALLYFLSVKFPNLFPAPDNTTPPAPSQKSPVPPAPPSPDSMFSDIDRMDGHAFELWCADLLRSLGYSDVELTKSIGDQGVDILATKDGIRYAIQCKCYSSDLGNHPVQEVHAGKYYYQCHLGVVMTNRYFTTGAKELAKTTGILLWDRDVLKVMFDSSFQLDKK